MISPNAEFWRLWGCALALSIALIMGVTHARGETGRASFYGAESGRITASGQPFRPMGLTAAHRSLPLGTRLRVTFAGRAVVVTINDRGPAAWTGRSLDLSRGAARVLGFERLGVALVRFTRLN